MRYNVHSPCAFHSRIAKSIGVLVAAALVAALGMPSLAQAQTNTKVTYADDDGFTVTWDMGRLAMPTAWIVTFTNPAGTKVAKTTETSTPVPVMLDKNDLGTWWIQVGACFDTLGGDNEDTCPAGKLEEGPSVGYTHGPFQAPEGLTASLIPDGVYLSWTAVKDDLGFVRYQYSTDGEKWAIAGDGSAVVDAMPGDQTFWVRAQGQSDNDLNTLEGLDGVAESNGMAASVDLTVPMPTPTNTLATGAPTITGMAQVGQTLTAGTTAIMDADGLTSVSYTYQWIRVATDNTEMNIASATASTYTLVAADQGTTIKVTVSFTDDASNAETLTSAATAAVSAMPTPTPTLPEIALLLLAMLLLGSGVYLLRGRQFGGLTHA